jgi:hypothetical protein
MFLFNLFTVLMALDSFRMGKLLDWGRLYQLRS